ncbi:MAG: LysE family translocator [Rhodovibrio sp.]|nr:LysE family translocator [Rhodovibrio sp.]
MSEFAWIAPLIVLTPWLVAGMAGYALATSASPGPVNIVAAMTGAQYGVGRSVPYVLGVTAGFVALLGIVGLGLGIVFQNQPWLRTAMAAAGGTYLIYLAITLARAEPSGLGQGTVAPPTAWSGLLAQWLNPKAWVVALSAVSLYTAEQNYLLSLAVFCLVFFVVCFGSVLSWVAAGTLAGRLLGDPARIRTFNRIMALLLIATVVSILGPELTGSLL